MDEFVTELVKLRREHATEFDGVPMEYSPALCVRIVDYVRGEQRRWHSVLQLALSEFELNVIRRRFGLAPCIGFGALRPDEQVAQQILLAVQPLAVEAAVVAEQRVQDRQEERLHALSLEHQQAEYEVRLATRRYEAVDPDNRLVASALEARWNAALERLRECEARILASQAVPGKETNVEELRSLAMNLQAAWTAPSTPMRVKQQLVRLLIREIVVDVDDATGEVILLLHWQG